MCPGRGHDVTFVRTYPGLLADQVNLNALHSATRARAEQGNGWLRTTFAALRRVTLDLWRISAITAAALVLLHLEHHRTT